MKAKGFTKETIRDMGIIQRTFPTFAIGDTIAVSQRIREGDKERLQVFQGDVIAIHNNGASSTFMVRKISANSIPVERIYPFHSPLIDSIKVVRKGDVRRAKLYYIRDRIGKSARVQERVLTKEEKLAQVKEQKTIEAKSEEIAQAEPVVQTKEQESVQKTPSAQEISEKTKTVTEATEKSE